MSVGEFQIATASDQDRDDLLIDSILASAIAAAGGDVLLLLPVLRPDVCALFGHPEFVAKVHEFVSARSHDPKYRRAFASYTPLRESLAHLDTLGPTTAALPRPVQSLRARWAVVSTAVARWCSAVWRAIDSSLAWIIRPAGAPAAQRQETVWRYANVDVHVLSTISGYAETSVFIINWRHRKC